MNNEEAKRQMRQGKRLRHADVEDDCFLFIDPLTGDVMFADLHGTYCEVASSYHFDVSHEWEEVYMH